MLYNFPKIIYDFLKYNFSLFLVHLLFCRSKSLISFMSPFYTYVWNTYVWKTSYKQDKKLFHMPYTNL